MSERPYITSVDLLACLLFDNDSRVQTIFRLREHFPLYNGCPPKFAKMPEPQTGPALTDDSKMILATAQYCKLSFFRSNVAALRETYLEQEESFSSPDPFLDTGSPYIIGECNQEILHENITSCRGDRIPDSIY